MDEINNKFVLACDNGNLDEVNKLMNDHQINFNNHEGLKMALVNGHNEIVRIILDKTIINEKICRELIDWVIMDENNELWKIVREYFNKNPIILAGLISKISELKSIDDETIPESKIVIYIPFFYRFAIAVYHWPIIGRIVRWFC